MNKDIQKQEILRLIRSIATSSGGTPPGERKFKTETGIGPAQWKFRIWQKWSDALAEAGFAPLEWGKPFDDAVVLEDVLKLAKRLGTFPNSSHLQFEALNNPDFVSYKAVIRRWSITELAIALRQFAEQRGETAIVAACDEAITAHSNRVQSKGDDGREEPYGSLAYVYLIKYGNDHKIGRTSSIARRSREVQIELPNETMLVHAILTDDPVGVEGYWHRRFADKRGNGEWFKLLPGDIAAFKKWTKIV
jgi:hypothetical protein